MQGTRALLALVIVMGVMIVLGSAGLVAVVVHRLSHPHPVMQAGSIVPGAPASVCPGRFSRWPAPTRRSSTRPRP